MAAFRVWAPGAKKVDVEVKDRRLAMAPEEHGYWFLQTPEAGPGDDYAFCLDDGPPLPDPRSPWQPQGVHAPSRLVDHSAFGWTDHHWRSAPLGAAVIYELHVGTFTPQGTYAGIIERLDYLAWLGVTHVELMPLNQFSGSRGWGYDGVTIFAPHNAYGTPDDLKRLVDACHARGLGVILDVVYNHFGPEGNYIGQYGPYFTNKYNTPWGAAVNYDGPGSDEVRRYIVDNALMWLRDYHIDGLRLDGVFAIFDISSTHIMEQMSAEVQDLQTAMGRHFFLIAETDLGTPRLFQPKDIGGYGLSGQWSDEFHHALHVSLTGEQMGYYADFKGLGDLGKSYRHAYVFTGEYAPYRQRSHGRCTYGCTGHNFVVYMQNHDQVGNRAAGDRIGHQMKSLDRQKVGAALTILSPFVPLLFQGEEWAASSPFQYFSDMQDVALRHAVSEGRKDEFASFGWKHDDVPDPMSIETFERSKLVWDERDRPPHRDMVEWYRQLIALRKKYPDLSTGHMERAQSQHDERDQWIILCRDRVTIIANLSGRTQTLPTDPRRPAEMLLASSSQVAVRDGGVEIPPNAVAVLGPKE